MAAAAVTGWSVPVRRQPLFSRRPPTDPVVAAFLAGQGEERFSVELHADGTVWYDLRAFSRPRYWPVRLAQPLARALQRRFVRESQAQMCRAVAGAPT